MTILGTTTSGTINICVILQPLIISLTCGGGKGGYGCAVMTMTVVTIPGSTAAAAPPPFRPGNPALCGSCPLVTPYYCRLGDLLCYTCMLYLSTFCVCLCMCILFSLFFVLFAFVAFPSVLSYCWLGLLTCKNRLPYNLYCVGGDVKHCTIQSNTTSVTPQLIFINK